jgi:hypothetical protein
LLPTEVQVIRRHVPLVEHTAEGQRGHIVKPTGPRKTWAIMYRDGAGSLRWEGKFHSRTDAHRRLTSVLAEVDKGMYTRPSSLTFEQFSKEWLGEDDRSDPGAEDVWRAKLSRRCRCRPSAYLNNVLEQDHRFLKRRMAASLWFRSVEGALRTIAGYEAMNMIRKGQIRWLAKGDIVGQVNYIEQVFGIAA